MEKQTNSEYLLRNAIYGDDSHMLHYVYAKGSVKSILLATFDDYGLACQYATSLKDTKGSLPVDIIISSTTKG